MGPRLVMLHRHRGTAPFLKLAEHALHNTWSFDGDAIVVTEPGWIDTLKPLLPQGFYALRRSLSFAGGLWPQGVLVQLGYTREGEPRLFIARREGARQGNHLSFADIGVGIPLEGLSDLAPLIVASDSSDLEPCGRS